VKKDKHMSFFDNLFGQNSEINPKNSQYTNDIQKTRDTIIKMKRALKSLNAEDMTDACTTPILCPHCRIKFQLIEGGNIFTKKPIIHCPNCKKLIVNGSNE
jgi:hypothetical protein